MDYDELVATVIDLLARDKRVPYRALKRRFSLDDEYIEDLKIDLIKAKKLTIDEDGDISGLGGSIRRRTTINSRSFGTTTNSNCTTGYRPSTGATFLYSIPSGAENSYF